MKRGNETKKFLNMILLAVVVLELVFIFSFEESRSDVTGFFSRVLEDQKNVLSIQENIDEDSIRVSTTDKISYIRVGDNPVISEPGKPRLPYFTENILVPNGKSVGSIVISKNLIKTTLLDKEIEIGSRLFPLSYLPLAEELSKVEKDELYNELYKKFDGKIPEYFLDENGELIVEYFQPIEMDQNIIKDQLWPDLDYSYSVQNLHGRSILVLNTYPIKYNPITRELKIYDFSISVNLNLADAIKNPKNSPEIDERIGNVVNYKDVKYMKSIESYQTNNFVLEGTGSAIATSSEDYKYVIITEDKFKGVWDGNCADPCTLFSCLIKHKICRDEDPITAKIVTKEEILGEPDYECDSSYVVGLGQSVGMDFSDSNCDIYGHNDDAAKIRNFIRDAYVTWNTEYVVLGGDADYAIEEGIWGIDHETEEKIIPSKYLSTDMAAPSRVKILSDIYYACLGGSYDENGNGEFGTSDDGIGGGDVDLLAEVYVGRVPVDNENEVNNFVQKTIAYYQSSGEYLSNVLMVGEYLGFKGIADYAKEAMEEVHEGSVEQGYLTSGMPPVYNIDSLYEKDGEWNGVDIIDKLNEDNTHMINHLGHSNVIINMQICNDPFGSSGYCPYGTPLDSIINDNYFLGYSQGCYPGAFDNIGYFSDSFMEHLVLDPHKAFAYISNTRFGWGSWYTTDGPSERFHRQFIDALYGERIYNIGKAQQDSKEDNIDSLIGLATGEGPTFYEEYSISWSATMRFVYYESTLFGDPETKIKIPEPEKPVVDLFIDRNLKGDGMADIIGSATEGFASDSLFSNYQIHYKKKEDSVWTNAGVVLENGGSLPVNKSVLAKLDLSAFSLGNYDLKIIGYDGMGEEVEDVINFVLGPDLRVKIKE
ncbi:MAG: hypothetical protein KKB31_02210, partial [Nanoarchaeota archaeon]|nr:hypothetical protein [Nanoarchaeota archaeon]